VWALTELLVETAPGMNVSELYREWAAELAAKKAAEAEAMKIKPMPAPGSVEWQEEQRRKTEAVSG